MPILLANEILDSVKKELQHAASSVRIITAYCKASSFMYLNKCINDDVTDKKLLIRFRMDDILKGSTDFEVIENGFNNGWDVYVRFDLHAKTYIVDNKRGIVGSANATNAGLSIGKNGNMEIATLVDIEPGDIEKIEKLYNDAIQMKPEILDSMRRQIETANNRKIQEVYRWDISIENLFKPHIDVLFSHELPERYALIDGEYITFMDEIYDGNIEKLKTAFRWSNAYLWLLMVLKENGGSMYFGELTEKLHKAMVSDPKPYRKDVKSMLSNLLFLIEQLKMKEIIIDRPNYSQRIRLSMM